MPSWIDELETRERALGRYRLMFRIVGICLATGVVLTAAGLLEGVLPSTASTPTATIIQSGLLLVVLSILVGYRITVSTMHLIEPELGQLGTDDIAR